METTVLLILAGLGYYFYSRQQQLEDKVDKQENKVDNVVKDYTESQKQDNLSPAEKYITITPEVILTDVTGNEWAGYIDWHIKNTSKNVDFVITRVMSNLFIMGYPTIWMPGWNGNAEGLRKLYAGKEITIRSTRQVLRWYNAGDLTAKNAIREQLRPNKGKAFKLVECDVRLWVQGANGISHFYDYLSCWGTVLLEGALRFVNKEGEDASRWQEAASFNY